MLKKDIQSEYRKRANLNGILLYLIATIFVVYLIFVSIDDLSTWIALYWVILIFAATNASLNSFKAETGRQFYYYYSLCNPKSIIFSKLIFNALLLLFIAFLNYTLLSTLLGNPIENQGIFLAILAVGTLSISSVLTLTAAIASKTNNNSTLTAILSFPILLPTLLTSIKASMLSGLGFGWEDCQIYFITLVLLNVVTIALSYILFPYLWRS